MDQDRITQAERHIAKAQQIIAAQKVRIARLKAVGAFTLDAEHTLKVFEANLRIFEDHRDYLKRALS
jgi:hypothetical protein